MDTDELSNETYDAVLVEAERFNHDLTLQFGLLSYQCNNEEEYIKKAEILVAKIRKYNSIDLDDMFFGNPPPKADLHKVLTKILENLHEVKKIPLSDRTFDF